MATLFKRVQKLEALLTDTQGLVPHSEEWFNFWSSKVDQVIAGESVDLRGMTLEFIDAVISEGAQRDQGNG